jgi:hypothetical protein
MYIISWNKYCVDVLFIVIVGVCTVNVKNFKLFIEVTAHYMTLCCKVRPCKSDNVS